MLVNRDAQRGSAQPLDDKPDSVGIAAICWPLGQSLPRDDGNCRRQRLAWTLDGTVPPTLQAADQPLGLGLRQSVWLDARGLRTAPGCPGASAHELALWPAPLEPWLPVASAGRRGCRRSRRTARHPAAGGRRAVHRRPARRRPVTPPRRQCRAASGTPLGTGGSGRRWWFLDGRPLGETAADAAFDQVLEEVGRHQLSLLDEAGATARLEFSVIE